MTSFASSRGWFPRATRGGDRARSRARFAIAPYDAGREMGTRFAKRDRVELPLARPPELDRARDSSACHLHVADADALHAE